LTRGAASSANRRSWRALVASLTQTKDAVSCVVGHAAEISQIGPSLHSLDDGLGGPA
jgi:nitroreductase